MAFCPTGPVGDLPAGFQVLLRIARDEGLRDAEFGSNGALRQIQHGAHGNLDGDQIPAALDSEVVTAKLLLVFGADGLGRRGGVQGAVLPGAIPAAGGVQNVVSVEGVSALRNVAPDGPGELDAQTKAPAWWVASASMIVSISPCLNRPCGVRPRKAGTGE